MFFAKIGLYLIYRLEVSTYLKRNVISKGIFTDALHVVFKNWDVPLLRMHFYLKTINEMCSCTGT